jgi:uncharacterized protein (TIRG00374 family)
LRVFAGRLLVSLLIAAGFVWLLARGGLPMLPPSAALERLAWWAPLLYIALTCLATGLRTYRWLHLLRPIQPTLSTRYAWGCALVGFAAVVFAPLRMGEMARPWLISRRGDVRFMQATGSVAAERVVDGLVLMSILAIGLALAQQLSPLPDHIGALRVPVALVPAIANSALLTFALAFTLMVTFYLFRELVQRIVRRTLSLVSAKLADWTIAQLERVSDGLRFLPSRRHAGAFLRDTLLYWAATGLAYWLLLRGARLPAELAQAVVIMGVMGLGSLLPSGPGFFGTYQLGAYCGLAMFYPESQVVQAGAVFIFVSYTCQLLVITVCGLIGLKLMASAVPQS